MGVEQLAASLTRLQDALADVRLPLDVPEADEHRELVRAQSRQIEDYVLPRLRRLDAPLLTVVGGSTGAGKSTLVNSLVGRVVTTPGVIRPTTRSSVLVHHPEDARWFESGQILPGLARSDAPVTDPRVLQLVPEPSMPKGLAILDAPDVDSVVAQNRTLAAQLLAAADLWLFVTSAARYADAVPWQYLRAAARRKAVVAVVLDRVPPAAMSDVPPHLGQMMSQRGLSASPLFAVPETTVDEDGLLPNASVAPIRGWLADLAEDTVRRNQVVLQTLDGAIESLADHGPALVAAVAAQTEALDTLQSDAEKSFAESVRSVAAQTADGTLLRGEVLARWQDFVGTGEFFRSVEKRIGLFRDRLVQVAKGEPKRAQDVQLAVESGLEVLIREEGEFAARRVVSAWEAHPAGRQLLDRDGALGKVSVDFSESAARVIRQWQGDVLELVGSEGKSKKSMARFLALGVNGAGVALMVFIFSQTGGLVGAEVGVAGGTALLAQRVLEAVFGEDAVRRLAKEAKHQLDSRVEGLMAIELSRFEKLIDEVEVRSQQGEELRAAVLALETERVAEDRYIREANVGAGLPEPSLPEPIEPGPSSPQPGDFQDAAADPMVAGEAESGSVEAEAGETDAVETDAGEPGADQDDVVPGVSAETPQRFLAGDTGLLPGLVSAQLSALAAGAVRHGEDDESDVQLTDEDDFDLPPHPVDQHGESDGDAEADAVAEVASADWVASDGEPESLAAESVAEGESLDTESVDDESVDDDEDTSADPDSADGESAEAQPAATGAERPIPVPAGLAALAAEAVRRPGEPRQEDQASAEPAAHESEQESASEVASPAESAEPAETPVVSLPNAPVLPSAPLPSAVAVGMPEPVEAEQADAEQTDAEQAEAGQIETDVTGADGTAEALAMALPTPPVLPSAPISFSPVEPTDGSTSWVNPAGGGAGPASAWPAPAWPASPTSAARRAVTGPTLPSVPLPAAPALASYADGQQDVTPSLLVPPDQIPPAPPVPRWPDPEPEPETESIAGVSGEETS
ncbi:hypothetical protein [Propionicimonas sp.]|uniref:hypothetical protein n=1 Tax=Propionicimonas sp. TaxID=1955623 RepID=UPI001D8BE19D|nr:hypothetical protein [Propionicimonas sp.]MBU3977840.1 hypothetical protein [Actinomycetota bacterium]MBU3987617.1 hypothetical protein [Actinomycetota bacterium]MBU4007339.1 hypothetical protein [Actinomycetota bacterium]MBU4065715.1 hypothetical protein [Actinomycetota bacterium]MBU4092069.1 hypothetical protein [Actinomycetota bacterium]